MKHFRIALTLFATLILITALAEAKSEQLVQYLPRNSHLVAGADFANLQENEVYQSMERNGQIWSYDDKQGIVEYIELLKLNTKTDIDSFAFSKYVNNYGASGKVHIFHMKRNWTNDLKSYPSSPYLGSSLYRLSPDQDMHATLITPVMLAVGSLNEVKMAVDVARGKVAAMRQNSNLASLYDKIPLESGVWAVAIPLSRRKAADTNAKQSTNAMISGFQSYYFYGVPTKAATRTQFYGQTEDAKQAAFMSSFMIGTLMVTKFRVDQPLAEMLDQIDIRQNGNTVHISMVVTKEMVDAYFNGKLGF
jgi:hypothetical protein